jgi:hypothetical protein
VTTTRDLMLEACAIIGISPIEPSRGSTETWDFYAAIAEAIRVPTEHKGRRRPKRELAEAIVGAAGLSWNPAWDGRETPSHGGGSISNEGLDQILASLHTLRARGWLK